MAALTGLIGLVAPLLVALAGQRGRSPTTADLLAWLEAAVLMGVAVGLLLLARRRWWSERWTERWVAADLGALAERVTRAESALDREQERLHQLRATLTGITLSHHLLHDPGPELPEPDKRRLAVMYDRELERLERLLSPGRTDQDAGAVDLEAVLDPVLASLAARGVHVRWAGTTAWAFARPDAVAEVVHTLLENAVVHGHGRGVALDVENSAGRVRLRVSDRGPGVPAALASRVFDRGVRGAHSTGDGLGLHIARSLAVEAGGHLWLDGEAGRAGSAFVLDLAGHDPVLACLAPSD